MNTTAQIIRSEKIQAEKEAEEVILDKCDCCLEPDAELFELGITAYGLGPKKKVCSYCLNELHQIHNAL